jgi:GTP pyrophosphokinase
MSRFDDLIAAIGFGKLAPQVIATDLNPIEEEASEPQAAAEQPEPSAPSEAAVLEVTGNADFLVYVAKCCNPVPGEEIVGYVTRGKGVAVHSRDCPNLQKLLYHPEREIEVRWASDAGTGRDVTSKVAVDMVFEDRSGMLASISQAITAEGSDILSCRLRTEKDQTGVAAMTLAVRDASQLSRVMQRLESLAGMLQVERRGYGRRLETQRT